MGGRKFKFKPFVFHKCIVHVGIKDLKNDAVLILTVYAYENASMNCFLWKITFKIPKWIQDSMAFDRRF